MNKDKFYRVVLPIIISVIVLVMLGIHLFAGVRQKNTTLVHEVGKTLQIDVTDYFDVNEKAAAEITLDTSKVDVNTVGTYEVVATYKMHKYIITVEVRDTKAPAVEFINRYIFTNNISNVDLSSMVEVVNEKSDYELKLVRFEKAAYLTELTEKSLKELTDKIPVPGNQETLKSLGTDAVPTEPGIYRAVVEVTDAYGNATYEEIVLIYDVAGASINEVADIVMYVPADKLNEKPEIDLSLYKAYDDVDGLLTSSKLGIEVVERDASKHEWLVKVSYTDRAGNATAAEFLITVEKEEAPSEQPTESEVTSEEPSSSESPKPSESQNPSESGNGDVSTEPTEPEKPVYTYTDLNQTMYVTSNVNVRDLPSTDGTKLGSLDKGVEVIVTGQCKETSWYRIQYNGVVGYVSNKYLSTEAPKADEPDTGTQTPGGTQYDPMDENKDGMVSQLEEQRYITPEKQAVIDAGYGVVVPLNGGEAYAVLTHNGGYVDGVLGMDILRAYLKERHLKAGQLSGCYIDSRYDWYWFVAEDITEFLPCPYCGGEIYEDWDFCPECGNDL